MSRDHSELEARLSAAYSARAELVTPESLSPVSTKIESAPTVLDLHEDRRPQRTRRPWITPLLVAAAVVLIAVGGVVLGISKHHHTPSVAPPSPSPSPLHTSKTVLQRGQEDSRADIPWNQVGPGWTLASWATSSKDNAPQTLYLVNPVGGRYNLSATNGVAFNDLWSPDGHRYLTGSTELDLVTGVTRQVRIPHVLLVSYTPTGYGFFGYKTTTDKLGNVNPVLLERFSSTGQLQATYPTTIPVDGFPTPQAPLVTDDGSQVVAADAHGLVIFHGDGKVEHTASPVGQAGSCQPVSWWSPTVAVTECSGEHVPGGSQLWRVPLSGAAPSLLAKVTTGNDGAFGYADAWSDSSGLVGLAHSGCGPDHFVRFDSAGKATTEYPDLSVTKYGNSASTYVGHDGDYLTVLNPVGCAPQATALLRTNSVTQKSVVLLGPGLNAGKVTGAMTFGGRHER